MLRARAEARRTDLSDHGCLKAAPPPTGLPPASHPPPAAPPPAGCTMRCSTSIYGAVLGPPNLHTPSPLAKPAQRRGSRGTAVLGVDRIAWWPPGIAQVARAAARGTPCSRWACGSTRQSQNGILMVYEYCTGTFMVMVHTLKYPRLLTYLLTPARHVQSSAGVAHAS